VSKIVVERPYLTQGQNEKKITYDAAAQDKKEEP
jgi:hypothetical protein